MENKIKTILIILIAFFGAGVLLMPGTFAQANDNLKVEFETTPLFDEVNFLPGQNITRWVKVTNNSGQPQRVAAEAINWPEFPEINNVPEKDLSRVLNIVIREKDGNDLYGGSSPTGEKTLFDFYQDGETYLSSDIPTGSFKEYEFEVIFPAEKEKDWQAATTTFDILIGFQGTGGQVPPGGGGGGGYLPPGLTILYEKDFYIGTTTAKITWSTSYDSTSRVIYDTHPGMFNLNSLPNYGYALSTPEIDTPANTNGVTYHEVEITGLASNTTYYYRCISHGSLAISTEHSFTTLGVEEAGEEVEGEEEIIEEKLTEGEIEGEKEPAFTEVTAGKEEEGEEEEETIGGLEWPELVEVGIEEPTGLGKFLAAIGAFPFNLKVILIIFGLILIGLLSLWLIKKKK